MRPDGISPETIVLALIVGLLAGLAGLALRHGLQAILDEFVGIFRDVFGWAKDRAVEPRVTAAPWVCAECHSVNVASAKYCYRGCGERAELEDLDPLGSHRRAGTARQR
jgi:hypothetical protein